VEQAAGVRRASVVVGRHTYAVVEERDIDLDVEAAWSPFGRDLVVVAAPLAESVESAPYRLGQRRYRTTVMDRWSSFRRCYCEVGSAEASYAKDKKRGNGQSSWHASQSQQTRRCNLPAVLAAHIVHSVAAVTMIPESLD